jgi:hypothetical protein
MELLVAVIITPALIGAASLGAKRWGPSVAGWLLAFPVISAPLFLVLTLSRGVAVCQQAATGALAGGVSIAAFCLLYSWAAVTRRAWQTCLLGGLAGFVLVSVPMLQLTGLALAALVCVVLLALAAGVMLMPALTAAETVQPELPWDVPVRMVLGAVVVLAVELAVPLLGSGVSGILSMVPVTTSIVSVFTHRTAGPNAVVGVQRGLLVGLFGTTAFSTAISALIVAAGPLLAFPAAIAAVTTVQLASLILLRRRRWRPPALAGPPSDGTPEGLPGVGRRGVGEVDGEADV